MIKFQCNSNDFQDFFTRALRGLDANCRTIHETIGRVLIEGGIYQGIWMECAPLEGLVYAPVAPDVARRNHVAFFLHQRENGQFPSSISEKRAGFAQIQQVVPMAATAYELGIVSEDEELLEQTCRAWKKWDEWICTHRDTRKRNVCEAFCEYDTGHDNSFRFHGLPKACPDQEAANCPDLPRLPYAAPDLTATMFGGRLAMAKIAAALGDRNAQAEWLEKAEKTRKALFQYCFDPESEFFYDRDAHGNLVKNLSDAGLRVLGEHAVDQTLFDRIFERWIGNPEAFWTPYPIPSVAACDPGFRFPPPENCWGGASQALLALRTPRWLEHYGRFGALNHLMKRWLEAMLRCPDFMQQMNPFTGEFSTSAEYSPSMCCALDFTTRLAGVMETPEGLSWGCTGIPETTHSRFELNLMRGGSAAVVMDAGTATLFLDGREFLRIRGPVRCFSGKKGERLRITAVSGGTLEAARPGTRPRKWAVRENQNIVMEEESLLVCQ